MAFLREMLELLNTQVDAVPQPWGPFHVVSLVLSVLAGLALCWWMKKPTQKQVRMVVLIISLVVVLLEIYKQINHTFRVSGDSIESSYQWYIFPWQFCSTPMYIGLLAALTKKRLHRASCAYLGSFSLFAGLAVMVYPVSVFTSILGINIQTMVCHGSMITIGMWLLGTGYVKLERKTILRAALVFAVVVGIAVALNEWAYRVGIVADHYFNMFYVSPYCDPHLPVYSDVQNALGVDNPLSFIIYVAAFTLAAYLMLLIAIALRGHRSPRRTGKKATA